ncbi:methylamine dehydrogenase accessory protein MauD [Derxia lacustris]|uniref:methylamine dehydrogenase accessory protein MauD n=1 Tax=Derxia lacustris TaxID=764842 RepID=UPI000A16EDDB|nr:methylamine dehydrogenase accessory protein MauD [Derxia lacustris]
MTLLYFIVAVLALAVIAMMFIIFALARQIGILFERISPVGAMVNDSGPKIGELAPVFNLPSLTGGQVQIGSAAAKSRLVFFLSPSCPVCKKLIPAIKAIQQDERQWLDIALASDGDESRHRQFIADAQLSGLPYVLSEQLGVTYKVARLPFAVLIDSTGVVRAKGLVNTREQLESLFNAVETGFASVQDFNGRQLAHSQSL